MHGARATALGFVVRFGARILFLYLAARLFGAALFGAYALATAAVELAVAVGGIGSKRLLFKHLDDREDRAPAHVVLDSAVLVAAVSLAIGAGFVVAATALPASLLAPEVALGFFILAPMEWIVVGIILVSVAPPVIHLVRERMKGGERKEQTASNADLTRP